jgi:hypothetical protein
MRQAIFIQMGNLLIKIQPFCSGGVWDLSALHAMKTNPES